MSPENQLLEDVFPIEIVPRNSGHSLVFGGVILIFFHMYFTISIIESILPGNQFAPNLFFFIFSHSFLVVG